MQFCHAATLPRCRSGSPRVAAHFSAPSQYPASVHGVSARDTACATALSCLELPMESESETNTCFELQKCNLRTHVLAGNKAPAQRPVFHSPLWTTCGYLSNLSYELFTILGITCGKSRSTTRLGTNHPARHQPRHTHLHRQSRTPLHRRSPHALPPIHPAVTDAPAKHTVNAGESAQTGYIGQRATEGGTAQRTAAAPQGLPGRAEQGPRGSTEPG